MSLKSALDYKDYINILNIMVIINTGILRHPYSAH